MTVFPVLGFIIRESLFFSPKSIINISLFNIFESIKEALVRGEKIEIRGFGNFKPKNRRPRRARNPKTGEKVEVPEKRVLHFKVGKALREAMNPK